MVLRRNACWVSVLGALSSPAVADNQRVEFDSLDGKTRLTAFLSLPSGPAPHPAIVMLHGCSGIGVGGGLYSVYSTWIAHLNGLGFATLAIDSATPRGFGETCGASQSRKVMYAQRPKDAYAGLTYLQARGDVAADRIGLAGWSQGGGITLLTMSERSIGRPEGLENDFKAAVAFYPSACSETYQSEPYTDVPKGAWATVAPLLVLQGASDNWTPAAPCEEFIKAARERGEPVDIKIYPDAAHSFDWPNLKLGRRSRPRLTDGSYPLRGTDPQAREDVLKAVPVFFLEHLSGAVSPAE